MPKRIIDHDLVKVYGDRFDKWKDKTEQDKLIKMLYWGDEVEMPTPGQASDENVGRVDVRVYNYGKGKNQDGYIKKNKKGGKFLPLNLRAGSGKHLLEVTFVDVQQGDATLIRTPDRKLIVVDGGEEVFLARILASMFPFTTRANPLDIDALVISHGDADHFSGLVKLAEAANETGNRRRKRIFTNILRYYHNGMVKLPSSKKVNGKSKSRPDREMFGATAKSGRSRFVTDLWDDPRDAPLMNGPFTNWATALTGMIGPGAEIRR